MARLTIEHKWWIDPRRSFLEKAVASEGAASADGIILEVWRIAQEYWGDNSLLPWRVFSKLRFHREVLNADLAERRAGPEFSSNPDEGGDWVYVRGSKSYFTWILDIREARRVGGQRSAKRPRDAKGRLLPNQANDSELHQQTSKSHPSESNSVHVLDYDYGLGSKELNTTLGAEPAEKSSSKVLDQLLRNPYFKMFTDQARRELIECYGPEFLLTETLAGVEFMLSQGANYINRETIYLANRYARQKTYFDAQKAKQDRPAPGGMVEDF